MKKITLLSSLIILPLFCFGAIGRDSDIDVKHQVLSLINYVLVVVSLISIRQFFWPGDRNNTIYQAFNMLFTVVYYAISLTFIMSHRIYYEGYESLTNLGCIRKFFFDFDVSMVLQLVVVFSFIINILYITKYGKRFYLDMV